MPAKRKDPMTHEKSIRLSTSQIERLEKAAQREGIRASEFIREAIERRCDETLGSSRADDWSGFIGILNEEGFSARDSKALFNEAVMEKHAPHRRRTRT